jgi:hypothetical protein
MADSDEMPNSDEMADPERMADSLALLRSIEEASPDYLAQNAYDYQACSGFEVDRTYKPLPRTLTDRFTAPSHSSLGTLDVFPLEILEIALTFLDFTSFVEFSKTSWQAHEVVCGTREYRAFRLHFSTILRAMDRENLAQWHSVRKLYNAFRSISCFSCGNWAPTLHMADCRRYCYLCFDKRVRYWALDRVLFDGFPRILEWLEAEDILRARPVSTRAWPPRRLDLFYLKQDQITSLAKVIDCDEDVNECAYNHTRIVGAPHMGALRTTGTPILACWYAIRHESRVQSIYQQDIDNGVDRDSVLLRNLANTQHKLFFRCPHLEITGHLEYGVFCDICKLAFQEEPDCDHPEDPSLEGFPKNHSERCAAVYRARSRSVWFDHIRNHCPGVPFLMGETGLARERMLRLE